MIDTNKNTTAKQPSGIASAHNDYTKPFVKKNFIFMAISLAMIVAGFLLMTGSPNGEGPGFNEDIFSARRIVVGPTIAFLGFVAMAFAILYTPKRKYADDVTTLK